MSGKKLLNLQINDITRSVFLIWR